MCVFYSIYHPQFIPLYYFVNWFKLTMLENPYYAGRVFMKLGKSTLGYAVAFTAGTLLSGSAVFAATNMVQAQKANTQVQYHGNTISKPPGLVYGGSMYVQLYSIQQAMKQAGFTAGWNGSIFSLNENSAAKLSGGSTDTYSTWLDDGYSVATVLTDILDFAKAAYDPQATDQSMLNETNHLITDLQVQTQVLQKDAPTDSALNNINTQYVSSLNEMITAFTDFKTGLANQDSSLITQFQTDFDKADSDFQAAMSQYSQYTPPTPQNSTGTNEAKVTHSNLPTLNFGRLH